MYKIKIMKKWTSFTKKQIFIIALLFISISISLIGIYIYVQNHKDIETVNDSYDYVITERFFENSDSSPKVYEVRYFPGQRKSYLILTEENNTITEKVVAEVETRFTKEYIDFTIGNKVNRIKDLEQYVDDSDYIYMCSLKEMEDYLSNEGINGRIKSTYATPSYFQCYIEKETGNIMRGLILYNSDLENGTLIYKQCLESVDEPSIFDTVTVIESVKKQ